MKEVLRKSKFLNTDWARFKNFNKNFILLRVATRVLKPPIGQDVEWIGAKTRETESCTFYSVS